MKTYVQPGNTVTLAAPHAVTSGDGMLVGAIFGVATHDAAQSEPTETLLVGVVDLNKVGAEAWVVGDRIYWDNTNRQTTKVATDNTLIGIAMSDVGNGADEVAGRVRLNGSF